MSRNIVACSLFINIHINIIFIHLDKASQSARVALKNVPVLCPFFQKSENCKIQEQSEMESAKPYSARVQVVLVATRYI